MQIGIRMAVAALGLLWALLPLDAAVAASPAVSVGRNFACALSDSGRITCWGDAGSGRLATGEQLYTTTPTPVAGVVNAFGSVVASQEYTCALSTGGEVFCWGANEFGQLGNGTNTASATPARVKNLGSVVGIATGDWHACAVIANGDLWCWGLNRDGQLGTGTADEGSSLPVKVRGLPGPVISASAGQAHTCAVTAAGTVWCWGASFLGQLGNGSWEGSLVPVQPAGITGGVTSVSVGLYHTCVTLRSGPPRCWGYNAYGQLGDGTTNTRNTPVPVINVQVEIASVSAGHYYNCAITIHSTIVCWGSNIWDVFGNDLPTNGLRPFPVPVSGLTAVRAISTSRTHVCAMISDGRGYCWGLNVYGAVGDGTTTNRSSPARVMGLPSGLVSIAAGNLHSCGVTTGGRAWCWGYNANGHLGGDGNVGRSYPAVSPKMPAGMEAVRAGHEHACGMTAIGGVLCWGAGEFGQLGNNDYYSRSDPVEPNGLHNGYNTVSVGALHSCAANHLGGVVCWGHNGFGQLGNGGFAGSAVPKPVSVLTSGVVALSAGAYHNCALTSSGAVYCWGTDYRGALGGPGERTYTVPRRVEGLPAAKAISGSLYHQCAVTLTGEAYCWGSNEDGQLGDGSRTSSSFPVRVRGLPDPVAAIAAGHRHSCALTTRGAVYCWGHGGGGELGQGTFDTTASPVLARGLGSGVLAISAGTGTCAVTSTGVVLCWGESNFGQLGDGTYAKRAAPVAVLERNGAGALDTANWFLDLIPSKSAKNISDEQKPPVLSLSQLKHAGAGFSFDTTIKYKAAEYTRPVNNYVFAMVPPSFFSAVKLAPGALTEAQLRAKSGNAPVFAQLTPVGWTNAQGQLIAHSQATANAAGSAASILDGVRLELAPGARFCVGYGTSAADMFVSDSFREVLIVEGALAAVNNRKCVLSGVYLEGPRGSKLGTPVTFVASVVGIAPTGTVQFYDGTVPLLAAQTLQDLGNEAVRRAAVTTSSLALGTHSIGASYSGGGPNAASSATPLAHEVTAPTASARVELEGPRDSVQGRSFVLQATVSGANPTGRVQLKRGGLDQGAAATLIGGSASFRIEGLGLGSHSFSAVYLGDSANAASTSNVLEHRVYEALSTRVAISSSSNPAPFGAAVTLTATVTGNNPTGSIAFREGTRVLARAGLANGAASTAIAGLSPGLHTIEADYSGDGANQAVTSPPFVQEIGAAPATAPNVFLASSANPASLGQSVTFTATVSGTSGHASGTVEFRVGDGTLCSVELAGGSAACTTTALSPGVNLVRAAYSGGGPYPPSVSSVLSQSVAELPQLLAPTPATLDFGVQGMNTTSAPVSVTLRNTQPGPVTFVVTILPAGVQVASNNCPATLAAGASCQMAFTFKPVIAGSLAGAVIIGYHNGATTLAVRGTAERSLVGHYYRSILRRDPDAGGRQFWENEAARVAGLGMNVNEAWFAMAMSFYNSSEYVAFGRSPQDYVRDLYNTFFNRTADDAGLNYWAGQMSGGMPREVVLVSFMFSNEFAQFARSIFGNTAVRAEVDTVTDFYRGLLARLPDTSGFNFWVGQFRQAQCQGGSAIYEKVEAISSAYANSPEYAGRNRTNAQYIGDLYNAFLRRGGDLDGVRFWIGQLDSGARTRDQVRRDFMASPEFNARVVAIVNQGCLP